MSPTRVAVGVVAAAAALAAASRLWAPPAAVRLAEGGDWPIQVRGVFHLHTRRSDGTGSIERVAAAAAAAGLRFVIATDHGDGTRPPAPPAYRSGVLCIDAVELSSTGGHYAALDLPRSPYPLGGDPADVVEDVRRFGGFGIVTHPDSPKAELAWQGSAEAADGLEWLNGDSEWRDESWLRLGAVVFRYPWRPAEVIASTLDRAQASLDRWDRASRRRPTLGIGGNDAHGGFSAEVGQGNDLARPLLAVPSYEASFRALSLLVEPSRPLSGDARADSRLVTDAIRAGHVATVIDGLATPARFAFTASSNGATAGQGDRLAAPAPVRLAARGNAPAGATFVLLKDGAEIGRWSGAGFETVVGSERAAYRVEILLDGAGERARVPWLVSNPIYVGYGAAPALSGGADAVPASDVGPGEPRLLWPVPGAPVEWVAEHDPRSSVLIGTASPAPPVAIDFTVALGPEPRASQYGAVALRLAPGLLRDAARIRFSGASDRPCRLSVQARQPEGRDGRRWVRSVFLDAARREVVVDLSDLRAAEPGGQPAPALEAIEALLFAIDTVNLAPGDRRTIRLSDLVVEARSGR